MGIGDQDLVWLHNPGDGDSGTHFPDVVRQSEAQT